MLSQPCFSCARLCASRSKIVLPTLPAQADAKPFLLCIGEAPGKEEDEAGAGFVGKAGKTLRKELVGAGLSIERRVGFANVVRCRPPDNRKPTADEIDACLPKLAQTLLEAKPKVLLLVGTVAVEALLGSGPLLYHIKRQRQNPILLVKDAHHALKAALQELHERVGGVLAVPMPHTSGLAWNRKAPDGRYWRDWGREQVRYAACALNL